jgi:RNA polymerase sigma factor (sigma-70 family)
MRLTNILPNRRSSSALGPPTDEALLSQFSISGDESPFAQLIARHGPSVYGFSRRLVNRVEDAEDIYQAAFLVLARKAKRLRHHRSILDWLLQVVRKLAADVRRGEQRRLRREKRAAQLPVPATASLLAESREAAKILVEELSKLPPKLREPLLLCYWEGLSKPEAAKRLHWPEGTVSGRLFRGKALLRVRLERRGLLPAVAAALTGGAVCSQAAMRSIDFAALKTAFFQSGKLAPLVPLGVLTLYRGALISMWLNKVKLTLVGLSLIAALLWVGSGFLGTSEAHAPLANSSVLPEPIQNIANDKEQLQGTWYSIAVLNADLLSSPDLERTKQMQNAQITFTNDTVTILDTPDRAAIAMKYSLGQPTIGRLRPIDFETVRGVVKSVYLLEGGVLMLRFGGAQRPEQLAIDGQSQLYILQRKRPQANPPQVIPNKPPIDSIEGIIAKNMLDISQAICNYEKDYQRLPQPIVDKNGNPLLSWRVAILPYLRFDDLRKQFHDDEPWDSEHNKHLLAKMPAVFSASESVLMVRTSKQTTTPYRALVGNGAAIDPKKRVSRDAIRKADGLENTLLFVEAAESVPWTKPAEIDFDPTKPLPKLGGRVSDRFGMGTAVPSAGFLPKFVSETTLRKLITYAGGETIDPSELRKK